MTGIYERGPESMADGTGVHTWPSWCPTCKRTHWFVIGEQFDELDECCQAIQGMPGDQARTWWNALQLNGRRRGEAEEAERNKQDRELAANPDKWGPL